MTERELRHFRKACGLCWIAFMFAVLACWVQRAFKTASIKSDSARLKLSLTLSSEIVGCPLLELVKQDHLKIPWTYIASSVVQAWRDFKLMLILSVRTTCATGGKSWCGASFVSILYLLICHFSLRGLKNYTEYWGFSLMSVQILVLD